MAEEPVDETVLDDHDGVLYVLEKSKNKNTKTGYEGVYTPRPGQYHAKLRLDLSSTKQTTIPGPACKSAKEAALRLAKYKANPYPIEKKDPSRADKGQGKVCACAAVAACT